MPSTTEIYLFEGEAKIPSRVLQRLPNNVHSLSSTAENCPSTGMNYVTCKSVISIRSFASHSVIKTQMRPDAKREYHQVLENTSKKSSETLCICWDLAPFLEVIAVPDFSFAESSFVEVANVTVLESLARSSGGTGLEIWRLN